MISTSSSGVHGSASLGGATVTVALAVKTGWGARVAGYARKNKVKSRLKCSNFHQYVINQELAANAWLRNFLEIKSRRRFLQHFHGRRASSRIVPGRAPRASRPNQHAPMSGEAPAASGAASDSAALEQGAMIEALKRKLIETNEQLLEAKSQLTTTESTLEVEKREHELTTTKLSLLLRKRSHQATALHDDNMTTDVGQLHQQIAVLQQQLRCSQESETQLRTELSASAAQYEKLRLLTLEGFRSQRQVTDPTASPTGGLLEAAAVAAATAAAAAPASAPATAAKSPMPQSMADALRMAMLPPRHAPSLPCTELWRRPSEHATPRVGMPRSKSDMSAVNAMAPSDRFVMRRGSGLLGGGLLSGAPMHRSISEMTPDLRAGMAGLACPRGAGNAPSQNAAAPAASAEPVAAGASACDPSMAQLPVASATVEMSVAPATGAPAVAAAVNTGGIGSPKVLGAANPSPVDVISKVPFGYAKGAICVELPKRQRTTVSSVMASPRMSSSKS